MPERGSLFNRRERKKKKRKIMSVFRSAKIASTRKGVVDSSYPY